MHLVGKLDALEYELTTYEPGTRKSPNRYDAATYAIIELRGLAEDAPATDPKIDVASAAQANAKMRDHLLRIGKGRRVGM